MHNSLLFNEQGVPDELLWQSYQIRSAQDFGKSKERTGLPFEQKEGYRWQEHFEQGQALCQQDPLLDVVYIADSEADILDVFQAHTHPHMHFIIRSKHDRRLADESECLHSHLSRQPVQGFCQASLLHPLTKKERRANLEVRFSKIQLKQHRKIRVKPNRAPVSLYVVQAKEVDAPPDIIKPVNWILLTSLSVESFEQALQITRYYSIRWLVERFHYILKSGGAEVEELQLETAHRLKNAITAYSIAAIGALKIRYWAEKSPDTSIYEAGITPLEHEVLYTFAKKTLDASLCFDKEKPPTVAQYCRVLGQIGGFFPSKRQPLPGFKILTRAIETLNILVDAYLAFCQRTE